VSNLPIAEMQQFTNHLRARRERLRDVLRAELIATRREDYLDLAGQVLDAGDQSVAELLFGVTLSTRALEVEELRDTEAALKRMEIGTYGNCVDCGEDIALERLGAYPTAKRCVACQDRYERERHGATDRTPSL
jgi:DnaK suppressor protein